jgi:hypothetical protein
MKWYGAKATAKAHEGAVAGLQMWADDLLKASQSETPVAPIGGGFLRDSGSTAMDAPAMRAAVSYKGFPARSNDRTGGGNVAVIVHESMSLSHSTGKAKYLEDPLNASKSSGPEKVRAAIKAAL